MVRCSFPHRAAGRTVCASRSAPAQREEHVATPGPRARSGGPGARRRGGERRRELAASFTCYIRQSFRRRYTMHKRMLPPAFAAFALRARDGPGGPPTPTDRMLAEVHPPRHSRSLQKRFPPHHGGRGAGAERVQVSSAPPHPIPSWKPSWRAKASPGAYVRTAPGSRGPVRPRCGRPIAPRPFAPPGTPRATHPHAAGSGPWTRTRAPGWVIPCLTTTTCRSRRSTPRPRQRRVAMRRSRAHVATSGCPRIACEPPRARRRGSRRSAP